MNSSVTFDKSGEQELLVQLRRGDERAFAAIYKSHSQNIYRFILKFLKSPELTDDLAQEVFIKFWDKRAELPQLLSIRAYLLTMARNQAFNFLKRAAVDATAKGEIVRNYRTEGNTLENAIHFEDYQQYLEGLLAGLTPQSREVFRLCRQQGKTYDEAAEILGISRNAVKKHMVRTMRTLGDQVERDLGISLSLLLMLLVR